MCKRYNANLSKIHRSYTVEEVAILLGAHKNTVRTWLKKGLAVCDDNHPILILGSDLRQFIKDQKSLNKRKCKPCEIYCMKCREPRLPDQNSLSFIKETETKGRVMAQCSVCDSFMNKYFKLANLATIQRDLAVILPLQLKHIS
jgi:hypothetical protein